MNATPDPFYEAVKQRVADLTPQQWVNVRQRVRKVAGGIPSRLYLVAIDAAINAELAGAPAPPPCQPPAATPPQVPLCLEKPIKSPYAY